MTTKAHALGMNETHFANASGLPNSEQLTTAHDLAILGRAIQERFPIYYRYFATTSFRYDALGNLILTTDAMGGATYTYSNTASKNLLASYTDGSSTRHFTYTANGNMATDDRTFSASSLGCHCVGFGHRRVAGQRQ